MTLVLRLLMAAAGLLAAVTPAQAALNLCNRTSYVLYAATAALDSHAADVKGWTRIVPGECVAARPEKLTRQTYLVHARSSIAHGGPARAWGGKRMLCVRDGDFSLKQSASGGACPAESFPLGFAALDTRGRANWTMTLDEPTPLGTLQAAQLAGVKRLLRDNGYKVGPIDGSPDKATGVALAEFRKKFAPDADNAGLFKILEDQARKHAVPAGLTACNRGKVPLLVALAQTGHGKKTARGWWTVAPGGCARLQTVPLAADVMYLLARTQAGVAVKDGPAKFCVAGAAFDIKQADGNCAARGFDEAGFWRIDAHGAAGAVLDLGAPASGRRG